MIEDFQGDWQQEWFTYRPDEWTKITNKLNDDRWKAPQDAQLALQVRAAEANQLVIVIDEYAAEVELTGGTDWQAVVLNPDDFQNVHGDPLPNWEGIRQLKLTPAERLQPNRRSKTKPRIVGKNWRGAPPAFRDLRWQVK